MAIKIDPKYGMRLPTKKGALKAFFNFTDTELGIEFHEFRLISGSNGMFIGSPSRSYEKDGETKYSDYIRITDKNKSALVRKTFGATTEVALENFNRAGG
jgi:DNA-binding cell septation regulator SpoVG